jgi:hypothetical protein
MSATTNSLKARIDAELLRVDDPRIVALVHGLLVEPKATTLDWDYGAPDEQYLGWVVLDDSIGSDTAIAYCDEGFGPKCPWGLVGAAPVDGRRSMGMDSAWFPTFMEAFFDSFAALEIERGSPAD